jgi:hypothetical protein
MDKDIKNDKDRIKLNVKRGQYGYINGHRALVIIRTCTYFILALGLFYLGLYTTHTKKNYFTIIAVLALLPACKSFVNMVMFIKARGCSKPAHEKIEEHIHGMTGFYDMYFTSEKSDFPVCHITVKGNTICGFTEYDRCNCTECEKHLQELLKKDGYRDETIKIYSDLNKYLNRLDQLNGSEAGGNDPDRIENGAAATLVSISLS